MFGAGVLEKRFESSYRYLKFFEHSKTFTWLENFQAIEASEISGLPELLVLLHPKWYIELGINLQISDPRGPKSFSTAPVKQECASEKYWGYKCPFENSAIHTDHIFPWSRGGATHFLNATYLCEEHNTMKFTDIHTMPWEIVFQDSNWVKISLEILISHAKNKTEEKLYFPDNQLNRS
jgi:hypothetical protein